MNYYKVFVMTPKSMGYISLKFPQLEGYTQFTNAPDQIYTFETLEVAQAAVKVITEYYLRKNIWCSVTLYDENDTKII